jgi:hypothetical protein
MQPRMGMSHHAAFAVVRLVPVVAIALASCGDNHVAPDAACHNAALQLAGGQYIDIASAPELDNPGTIEFWVRVAGGPGWIALSHEWQGPPSSDPYHPNAGGWSMRVGNGSVSVRSIFTQLHITGLSGGPLPAEWVHVAAVHSSIGFLYINGIQVGHGAYYPSSPAPVPLRIGAVSDGQPGFSGMIDEIRISRTRRYDGDFAVPHAPFVVDADTIALWHFSEGSGTTTADATGLHPAVFPADAAAQPVWTEAPCFDQMHP